VLEAQGGQRRNAAHYHCIVHRKRAGFGARLPRGWRTADQSRMQSGYDPRNAQKKDSTGQKNAREGKNERKGQQKNRKNAKYSKTIKTFADQDVFIGIPLSSPARSEILPVRGFPSASAAPQQRTEPRRLHSAWLTSCGTCHHTVCTLRPGSR
jgi:hypothetical protein